MSLIEIIPCLSDNYAYLIRDEKTNKNILVDAPEHGPIETYLDKKASEPRCYTYYSSS